MTKILVGMFFAMASQSAFADTLVCAGPQIYYSFAANAESGSGPAPVVFVSGKIVSGPVSFDQSTKTTLKSTGNAFAGSEIYNINISAPSADPQVSTVLCERTWSN